MAIYCCPDDGLGNCANDCVYYPDLETCDTFYIECSPAATTTEAPPVTTLEPSITTTQCPCPDCVECCEGVPCPADNECINGNCVPCECSGCVECCEANGFSCPPGFQCLLNGTCSPTEAPTTTIGEVQLCCASTIMIEDCSTYNEPIGTTCNSLGLYDCGPYGSSPCNTGGSTTTVATTTEAPVTTTLAVYTAYCCTSENGTSCVSECAPYELYVGEDCSALNTGGLTGFEFISCDPGSTTTEPPVTTTTGGCLIEGEMCIVSGSPVGTCCPGLDCVEFATDQSMCMDLTPGTTTTEEVTTTTTTEEVTTTTTTEEVTTTTTTEEVTTTTTTEEVTTTTTLSPSTTTTEEPLTTTTTLSPSTTTTEEPLTTTTTLSPSTTTTLSPSTTTTLSPSTTTTLSPSTTTTLPVPTTTQAPLPFTNLSIGDIVLHKGLTPIPGGSYSLRTISIDGDPNATPTNINMLSSNRPDKLEPHSIGEFRGYFHRNP